MPAAVHDNHVDRGWLLALAIILLTCMVGLVGLGGPAQYLFVALTLAATLWLLAGGRDLAALEFTLVVWAFSPGVRRFLDYYSQYHGKSIVLLFPQLLGVLVGLFALRRSRATSRDSFWFFVTLAFAIALGAVVGATAIGLTAAATGLVGWLGPLGIGVSALLMHGSDLRLRKVIERSALIITAGMGIYGIIQFFVLPAWDAAWISDVYSVANSFGLPHPKQVRVFSLSNSPSPMALLLLWGLLVVAFGSFPWPVRAVVVAAGLTTLELSQVRAAWLGGLVILLVLLIRGLVRVRSLAITAGAIALVLTFVGGDFQQLVTQRISTLSAGTQDPSLRARFSLQSQELPGLLHTPIGDGFGSTGSAARGSQSTGGQLSPSLSNADSGYLEMLSNFGPILTAGLLATLLALVVSSAAARRRRMDVALWAFVASSFFSLYFNDVFTNIAGAVTLLSMGYLGRPVVSPSPAAPAAAPISRIERLRNPLPRLQ